MLAGLTVIIKLTNIYTTFLMQRLKNRNKAAANRTNKFPASRVLLPNPHLLFFVQFIHLILYLSFLPSPYYLSASILSIFSNHLNEFLCIFSIVLTLTPLCRQGPTLPSSRNSRTFLQLFSCNGLKSGIKQPPAVPTNALPPACLPGGWAVGKVGATSGLV